MATPEFFYQDIFAVGKDETVYRLLTRDYVSMGEFAGRPVLRVEPEGLALLADQAFHDIAFYLRPAHLAQVAAIFGDAEASANDRAVALAMLRNAEVSAHGVLPFCQDTGTATVVGRKGHQVWTGGGDAEALSLGVYRAYTQNALRYSQTAPLDMYVEKNTGTNLPAQIDLYATDDGAAYKFLFVAKGGGSANKSYLFQETKALLNPAALERFLVEKMRTLGTAACPPYHLAVVVGGTSAEATMKTLKMASAKYYDALPTTGNEHGRAFRDVGLEARLHEAARGLGLGAQFGGRWFTLDVRVVRLPRHGASCPVGMGVSCSADRNCKAKITPEGIFIEQLETNPARFIPEEYRDGAAIQGEVVRVDLDQPMARILAQLEPHPIATRLALNGTIIVARDIAHAKLKERLDAGRGLPEYLKAHPVYYAGPAKTPAGYASGSFGPTTAGRMDGYVDAFQAQGASLVMIAKGNRSAQVTEACKRHGGYYLGSIGGPAAILAKENIRKVELLEYPELGMEAIWKIDVVDFPAFILVDGKGNDFFQQIASGGGACGVCKP
ncbi:MAG: fumarate hydratase [Puniceicoccales bacterium]|jgi:fumarate hydratase class I|nr:fumarate hydratase [Puniceicoccales bacterium]